MAHNVPQVLKSDTELKVGKRGVVNLIAFGDKVTPVGVTVVKIEMGKRSDLKGERLPISAKGLVPWYIRTVLSYAGTNYEGSNVILEGQFSDGSQAAMLLPRNEVAPCTRGGMVADLSAQHRTSAQCEIVLAPRGARVVAADYFAQTGGYSSPSFYVTWHK